LGGIDDVTLKRDMNRALGGFGTAEQLLPREFQHVAACDIRLTKTRRWWYSGRGSVLIVGRTRLNYI